jgi:hypothetical protein
MPGVGFEPLIPVLEWAKILYVSNHVTTVMGWILCRSPKIFQMCDNFIYRSTVGMLLHRLIPYQPLKIYLFIYLFIYIGWLIGKPDVLTHFLSNSVNAGIHEFYSVHYYCVLLFHSTSSFFCLVTVVFVILSYKTVLLRQWMPPNSLWSIKEKC